MNFKNIFKNNSAVSPVIGVVLMVAITVVLAAAIGSSVFGKGITEAAPQANIDISVVNDSSIKVEHLGGDVIRFENNDTTKLILSNESDSAYEINGTALGDFSVGNSKVLELNGYGSANYAQGSGTFVNIKIVDVKTKQLICSKDLRF